ncbi:MAG: MFS transporter [Desulfofustis sp.]|nr:MFS transporter [Desulfofustis sp.]
MTKPAPLSRDEKSWVLYDAANSAFVLVMITAIMPIYFQDVAAQGMEDVVATSNWAFANSTASLILALLAPVLGTMADYKDRKKPFFLFFLFTGLVFTVALTMPLEGRWLLCLLLFIGARVGWAGANLFYDAFLVDVAPPDRMDNISAKGFGFGYIGSVIPFIAVIGLILSGGLTGGLPVGQTKMGFIIVALWWFFLSLPAIKNLNQHYYVPPSPNPLADGFVRLWTTFKNIRTHRSVFLFLAAYFFYIDGVGTIITMATAYGRELGFGIAMLITVLLVIQIVAFPCTLLYGRMAARFKTRSLLMMGIVIYCLITFLAFLLPFIEGHLARHTLFWTIALLVASSMGGIQALSRSYFSKLIPPENSAEFFGFYNVSGKFAAIAGPALLGIVGRMTGDTRWGVLSILVLFMIGAWLLMKVKD